MPRQIAMFLLRDTIKYSYPSIGLALGGRDHTTAMHACNKVQSEISRDEKIKQNIQSIKQKLYSQSMSFLWIFMWLKWLIIVRPTNFY